MKRLYGSHNNLIMGHLHEVLEQHGIVCILRNQHLLGAAGELPPNECWPELWVADDADYPRARSLLDALLESPGGPAWMCSSCGETIEGQFTHCWRCGADCPES